MAVYPTTDISSSEYIASMQQTTNTAASAPDNLMGQEDFLRLLTTQLQNQDPSDPMDPTQFVTDLTQMSQLEATTKMNESIMAMTTSFQNLQTMQAASLIGKSVLVEGQDFSHTSGSESQFRLDAEEPLTDVQLVVTSESGMTTNIEVGDLTGEEVVGWDGLMADGSVAADGVYSLTAYGTDADGELKSVKSVVSSNVSSVSVGQDGGISLTLATGERVSMDDVREIGG